MIRICLTGPESTGKSTLSEQLARHYHTAFVPEFARLYLQENPPLKKASELEIIAKGQKALESAKKQVANRIIFLDTDFLTLLIWSELKFNTIPTKILNEWRSSPANLYLLCQTDIDWEPDPQRENPHDRPILFQVYQQKLEQAKLNYSIISGQNEMRFKGAIDIIDAFISKNKGKKL